MFIRSITYAKSTAAPGMMYCSTKVSSGESILYPGSEENVPTDQSEQQAITSKLG